MKKLVSSIFIFALVLFVAPSQTYAVWWNPISWFSSESQIEEQNQSQNATSSDTVSKSQTADQNVGAVEQQNTPVPLSNIQSSDAQTVKDLKADIVLLTNALSELLKAHNNLVNSHNALSKSVNATVSSNKNVGATTNNSNLEIKVTSLTTRVTELERKTGLLSENIFSTSQSDKEISVLEGKVEDICGGVFTFGCSPRGYPSLEDRIEKLERAY